MTKSEIIEIARTVDSSIIDGNMVVAIWGEKMIVEFALAIVEKYEGELKSIPAEN